MQIYYPSGTRKLSIRSFLEYYYPRKKCKPLWVRSENDTVCKSLTHNSRDIEDWDIKKDAESAKIWQSFSI